MEEEKEGTTFGDIFRLIFTQKWLALIIAVVITLVGSLLINYVYNPSKAVYSSTFTINVEVGNDGLLTYPDGTKHNYRDLISKNNLTAIKESDEAFKDIDVNGLARYGLSITQNKSDTTNTTVQDVTYTISIGAKAFKSYNLAVEFINAIAETPSREILTWVKGLSGEAEQSFNEKIGNEQKLEYLKGQLETIEKRFEELSLPSTAMARVETLKGVFTTLTGELHTAWYEPDILALQNYIYAIDGLNDELEVAQAALNNLLSTSGNATGTIVVNGSEIAQYSEKVTKLNQQITAYNNYIKKYETVEGGLTEANVAANDGEASKAFTAKLNAVLGEIKNLTDNFESDYYANTSLVSYEGAQVSVGGGMGLLTLIALSLIVGIIVALVVAYIVAKCKTSKVNKNDNGNQEGAQAKAAATSDEK
ncbi:MAG: hypothetical protein HDP34_02790 [Clostridia bacterium]|nr:hypothetical protein [Clostridia bacterium]